MQEITKYWSVNALIQTTINIFSIGFILHVSAFGMRGKMNPKDCAKLAKWFRQQIARLERLEHYESIKDQVDRLRKTVAELEERQMRMRMSAHAKKAWRKRVGKHVPPDTEVRRILSESVRIQQQHDLFTTRGYRVRVLALYWHPRREIVLKVDHRSGKVVTVLTPRTLEEAYENWNRKDLLGLRGSL